MSAQTVIDQSSTLLDSSNPARPQRPGSRSIVPSSRQRVVESLLLSVAMLGALVWALPAISRMQILVCEGLRSALHVDLELFQQPLEWQGRIWLWRFAWHADLPASDWFLLSIQAVICIGLFGLAWASRQALLRRLLQIFSLIYALSLLLVFVQGASFRGNLLNHTQVLSDFAQCALLISPIVMGSGFWLCERRWSNRLLGASVLVLWQSALLPIKLLLHALLAKLASAAILPMLFMTLGPIFDVLMFGTLYCWVMSWPPLLTQRRP